jgi:hypothetical protein
MARACIAFGAVMILLSFLTGIPLSDSPLNESVSEFVNTSPVKAGDVTLMNMIQLATGPVLTTETEDGFEGSWAFNCEDDYTWGFDEPADGSDNDNYGWNFDPFYVDRDEFSIYQILPPNYPVYIGIPDKDEFPKYQEPDVITQLGKLVQEYKLKWKKAPKYTPPSSNLPQPEGFDCVLGICDCSGYQIYCQPGYVIHHEDAAMWKARCC